MKALPRYRIKIENESHLSEIADWSVTMPQAVGIFALVLIITVFIGGLIVAFSPLRTLLPGYLKESERSATEESLLRLDSVMVVYEQNQNYIDNILRVADVNRDPTDSAALVAVSREINADSLLTASKAEQNFVMQMEERERYNISVLAPLAADGMTFSPICSEGVFAEESKKSEEGVVIMTGDSNVQCGADGTVVALYYSAPQRGYVIVVQHGRGFVTSYTHTGTPLVGIGDVVNSGQAIALAPGADSKGRRTLSVRLWHNGTSLVPYDYLGSPFQENTTPLPYDASRGIL